MKKSLVALAAMAMAGAASAQSSVTLAGVVDVGVSSYENKSETPLGVTAKTSKTALTQGAWGASRLIFRGQEDLGGGLGAAFYLDAAIFPDDGTVGGNVANSGSAVSGLFNRRSTVSLLTAFGEFRLGRDYTPQFWNDNVFDPFSTSGVGTNLISTANGYSSNGAAVNGFQANNMYVRTSNSVGYFLPPGLGGLYGQVMYAFNEQTSYDPGNLTPNVPNNSRAGTYVGGRFGFTREKFDVAASYSSATLADNYFAGLTTKLDTFNLGGSYDFDVVKIMGEYSRAELKTTSSGPVPNGNFNGQPTGTGYLLGFTIPVGPGLIRGSWSRVTIDPNRVLQFTDNPRADKWALGYVHNLSKRTALYTTIAQINNKNGYDLGLGNSPAYVLGGTFQAKTSRGIDVGIRTFF
ncbi:porin [Variovorax sp. Sphag1AA]|uniref:porin n=1 Tax=Variovorax sp. Sphag1AA TaxID=2587027 RepID=UPI00160B28C6|nr:porin [Variovorax sp. Sphag1AA]MBB3181077.1 putative porin [Variovorax sp. Sphag1AA]